MSNVGAVNNPFTELGLAGSPDSKAKKSLGQEDFLRLLVAQINQQNPLEPQSNGEFITQMAQFGTVDGVHEMQKSIAALASEMQSNQALQASSLVGHAVMIPSDTGFLNDGGQFKGAVNLPGEVHDLKVSIYSSEGSLVKTINLGTQSAGLLDFKWDGRLENGEQAAGGQYQVQAQGTLEGQAKSFGTAIAANVNSVTLGNDGKGLQLNLQGIGQVSFSQVRMIS